MNAEGLFPGFVGSSKTAVRNSLTWLWTSDFPINNLGFNACPQKTKDKTECICFSQCEFNAEIGDGVRLSDWQEVDVEVARMRCWECYYNQDGQERKGADQSTYVQLKPPRLNGARHMVGLK